jgi:hypothetical protein
MQCDEIGYRSRMAPRNTSATLYFFARGGWARTASSLMSVPQPGRVGTTIWPS